MKHTTPSQGHIFDENLLCLGIPGEGCGVSWGLHQLEPEPCPNPGRVMGMGRKKKARNEEEGP